MSRQWNVRKKSMASAVFNITFDCVDAHKVAEFWGTVTGYSLEEVQSPGNDFWVARPLDESWPRLVFVSVPERKVVKNRVHLDLMPSHDDQNREVDRLLSLGARLVDDRRELVPGGWVVLADPEGNEFCVE
jgi:predicted enzyme related to lactoylglutathione lyase